MASLLNLSLFTRKVHGTIHQFKPHLLIMSFTASLIDILSNCEVSSYGDLYGMPH